MSEINRIWKPSVESNDAALPHATSKVQNQTYTTTCLRAQTNGQIEQLNREILQASQSHNCTAKSFGEHKRLQSPGVYPNRERASNSAEVAMTPRLVHQQYNSPIDLYSMNNIKKTIEAHSELIAPGVKGINFLKSSEPVNRQSEVYKLVMEEEQRKKFPSALQPQQQHFHHPRALSPVSGQSEGFPPTPSASSSGRAQQQPGVHFAVETDNSEHQGEAVSKTERHSSGDHDHTHHQPLGSSSSPKQAKPQCCECGQLIVGPFAKLQDRFIHPHCINCTTCGTSLKNSGYFTINDKLYCDIHASQVANVMRLNYNFEPNKFSHQPAPTAATIAAPSMQRSRSTSSLFSSQQTNYPAATATMNEQQVASSDGCRQQFNLKSNVDDYQDQHRCRCASFGTSATPSKTTISTMFSNCLGPNQCCSRSCHNGTDSQRKIVWTWRPASQQQQPQSQPQQQQSSLVDSATGSCPQQQAQQLFDRITQTNQQATSNTRFAQQQTIQHQRQQQCSARLPICHQCNANIHGPYIMAGQSTWCKPCSQANFVCSLCRRSLLNCGFIETNEGSKMYQYYCEMCYEKYLAPICSKCSMRVKGDCLNALGKQWHPTCFVCGHCRQPFGNSSFHLEDDVPYCQRDWNLLFTTKCYSCSYPIEAGDKWIDALNKKYHTNCFRCTTCQLKLEGSTFYCKGGQPYCRMHAR